MLDNIKKELKEDLWKIIDNKDVEERTLEQFIVLIFYLLLEKENFTMTDVLKFSKYLKNKYEEILNESKNMAIMGEPIKAIKNIDKQFIEKIKPIIEKIIKK